MEEHDVISRREAVAGLGLLGVLIAGLIGTIVFRIVHARPKPAPQPSGVEWAMEQPPSYGETTADALAPAAADALHATPIATVESGPSGASAAAAESAPADRVARPRIDEAPRFVAPGNR